MKSRCLKQNCPKDVDLMNWEIGLGTAFPAAEKWKACQRCKSRMRQLSQELRTEKIKANPFSPRNLQLPIESYADCAKS